MLISEMCSRAYFTACSKGFHDADNHGFSTATSNEVPRWLALVHSEVSEALEEHRVQADGWRERFAEELADVLIRVGDTAYAMGLDLEGAVVTKMAKNAARPRMHGGKLY